MKRLALVLTLLLGAAAARADVSAAAPRNGVVPLPSVNGSWCRGADGTWVWVDAPAGFKPERFPRVPRPSRTVEANEPPRRIRPDKVNGIKWFEDGRSYFSD